MNSTDDKGKAADPVLLKSYLSNSADYTGMEIVDPKKPEAVTSMVFDIKNQASIIFLDNKGQKSSFAYKMDLEGIVDKTLEDELKSDVEDSEITVEKTGKTKDILGYECAEYHVKNEDGEGYYWISEQPIGGYSSFWSSNNPMMSSKTQEKYAERFKNLPKGNFMELSYISVDNSTVNMKVTEIDESASKSLTMAEYPNLMESAEKK